MGRLVYTDNFHRIGKEQRKGTREKGGRFQGKGEKGCVGTSDNER